MPSNKSEGTQGHVSGSHSGASNDQQPAPGGKADLANQEVKIVSGRYSPKSHLERAGMKPKKTGP